VAVLFLVIGSLDVTDYIAGIGGFSGLENIPPPFASGRPSGGLWEPRAWSSGLGWGSSPEASTAVPEPRRGIGAATPARSRRPR
jgi:hypothetical protein